MSTPTSPEYIPTEVRLTSELPFAASPPPVAQPELPSQYLDSIAALMAGLQPAAPQHAQAKTFITIDRETAATLQRAYRIRARAPVNESVLITGPSGSGKELIAQACAYVSEPFVAVNVAALPDTLLESLLFGHVRGSFTGATTDFPGAFRSAGKGTIFLDEIGDMPLHQQPALLRVLEERVVTPVGTSVAIPINCRIIAATNRQVENTSEFREDLVGRFTHRLTLKCILDRPGDLEQICNYYGLSPAGQSALPSDQVRKYGVRAIKNAAARERLDRD